MKALESASSVNLANANPLLSSILIRKLIYHIIIETRNKILLVCLSLIIITLLTFALREVIAE